MWKICSKRMGWGLFAMMLAVAWDAGCAPPSTSEPTPENAQAEKVSEKPKDTSESAKDAHEKTSTEQATDRAEAKSENASPDEPSTQKEESPTKDTAEPSHPEGDGGNKPEQRPESPIESKAEMIAESQPERMVDPSGPNPTVKIVAPKDKDTVKGAMSVEVEATVQAGATIALVELYVDNNPIDKSSKTPFIFSVQTLALKDGAHKLKAVATTSLGKQAQDEITVNSANFGPSITFLKPPENASVTGKFDIEVEVTDAAGLKANGVELHIDGQSVNWTTTTPKYTANFDPTGKSYDSLPIEVTAENQQGSKSQKVIWVIFDPPTGTKKAGEECDNTDAQKRCVSGASCHLIGGQGAKQLCYTNCTVGGLASQCPPVTGKRVRCEPTYMGANRGVCVEWEAAPGSLYSTCGGSQGCDTNLICAGSSSTGSYYCLKICAGLPGSTCPDAGFICVPLQNGGGVCVEQCQQTCKADTACSTGQTCQNGKCTGSYCSNYGTCQAITGLTEKICI